MYVEISPRQSGKTTRLIQAASEYLRTHPNSVIGLVSHNSRHTQDIKKSLRDKLALDLCWQQGFEWPDPLTYEHVDNHFMSKIRIYTTTVTPLGCYDPDYWFIDEFAYMEHRRIFPAPHENTWPRERIMTNAYYCTTPGGSNITTNLLVNYCRENNVEVNFVNPWTEARLEEQQALGPYMRDAVLGDWVDYMRTNGFPIEILKENWLPKFVKKHKFLGS